MVINIIIEPEYKDTVWCRETLCGIGEKAASLRYKTMMYTYDMLSADMKNIIIIGTSPSCVSFVMQRTSLLSINTVTVSCLPLETKGNNAYVLIDHNSATRKCISYFQNCGRNNIALYGINRNSYADIIKTRYFDDKDIFYTLGKNAMSDCYQKFFRKITDYNAVICSNYISAIHLMYMLKNDGMHIPKDLYVITYGDSVIGNMFNPSLTTVTLNHEQLGIQAVNICRAQGVLSENVSVTVCIPCEIHAAESTENTPVEFSEDYAMQKKQSNNIFKDDEQLLEIQSLEKMLRMCDSTDFKIIRTLLKNKSYMEIGNLMYMSESSVKYRVKRLLTAGNIESSAKILKLWTKYMGGTNE